ncbi:mechanosensitive ion channel family protein [Lysobacter changpingensis]|jgi:small-conductance mechanosensitive channel|uniref:mechanosensitive ion channel family protein n=1 Tax=Lysobacter changpingensis TaxID=2792784 RepID=UPI001A8CAC1D|nr:mechanosensitive ion channel family protein [Lysobacter changpingensis]
MNVFSPAGHFSSTPWVREWADLIVPLGEAALILAAAWLLRLSLRKLLNRVCTRYELPPEMTIGARRLVGTVIYVAATLLILQRLGVSAGVLWTALTGFAAVAAVAFFAAWSVLSNIFCTFLILTARPFRLHDVIELLENGEKPGLKGRVVDINLIYTTLQEIREDAPDTTLQIPNSQFFQRSIRRWREAG